MSYNLILRSTDGTQLAFISTYESLELAYKESDIGECVLQTNSLLLDQSLLIIDNILEVWRTTVSGATYLEGERVWYLRKWEYIQNGASSILTYRLTFRDANDILNRRIVAYAAASTYSRKTDHYDDMMKVIMRENFGALAVEPLRNIAAYLQVQSNLSLAASGDKAFSWSNVFEQLREICNVSYFRKSYLAFDTIYISPGLNEFRTYFLSRGVDHGSTSGDVRIVTVDNGSLANAALSLDYVGLKNYIYVGGQGREDAREIIPIQFIGSVNASVINRCEDFVNAAGSFVSADEIINEGLDRLSELRGRSNFSGNVVDTAGMQYGINYGFGDIVMVQFAGFVIDCHIDTVHITSAGGNETLDIKIHGEMPL